MRKNKFNPYDYGQYQNLPKPPAPERTLTPKAGMTDEELMSYRHIMRNYDEALQIKLIWNELKGTIYPTLQQGWADADNIESVAGRPLCRQTIDYKDYNP